MATQHSCHLLHPTLNTRLTGVSNPSGTVEGYRGIPFARVEKRWTRSKPVLTLGTEFDARDFGPKCPQPDGLNNTLDFGPIIPFPDCGEDELNCLNLNVYRPTNVDGSVTLPVLFWIHGGSLSFGANSDPIWDPAELVRWATLNGTPVVAVTINYRLGPFGFLSPIDPADEVVQQGNFGLHDQTLALEWVRRHIAGFGGDPDNVTLAGESAGGCSAHAQTIAQGREGAPKLFRRVIMQSGNLAVMGFWDRERMDRIWRDAVKAAGLEDGDGDGVDCIEAMRALPADELLRLPPLDIDGYGVYIDNHFVSPAFVSPSGDFLPHPPPVEAVLHGDNADEGNIFREAANRPGALDDLRNAAKSILGKEGCETLLQLYQLDRAGGLTEEERAERLYRIPEDARFYLPSAELQRVWPKSAFYHLTAKSPFASRCEGDSFHTLDLLYLFGNFDKWLHDEGKHDHLRLGVDIRKTWLRFIYGHSPWDGAYDAQAATFGVEGEGYGEYDDSRGWAGDRTERIRGLQRLGAGRVVELATRVFP